MERIVDFVDRYGLSASYEFNASSATFSSMKAVQHHLESITQAVNNLSGVVSESRVTQQFQSIASQTKVNSRATSSQVNRMAREVTDSLRPLKQEFRALRAEVRTIDLSGVDLADTRQFEEATRQVHQYVDSLRALERQITGNSAVEREFSATLKSQQKMANVRIQIADEQRKAAIAAERVGASQAARDFGQKGLVPLISVGVKSIRVLTEFNDQMSSVEAVMDPLQRTAANIDAIRGKAKALGAETRFSAGEAASGFVLLAQAGYAVDAQLKAIDGTLKLAASGNLGLAQATDITVSALGGFQLEADQAVHAADVLAKTANSANLDVTDLGLSLKYIAPAAKAFGSNIEQTSALIGVLSEAGIKGSEAGTALRSMFLRLAAPPTTAAGSLKQLNIQVNDSEGRLRSMDDLLGEMQLKLKDLGDAERLQFIKNVFGTEASSAAAYLLQSVDAVQALTKANYEASKGMGAAAESAAIMERNLGGAFRNLSSAYEGVLIEIGEILAPAVTEAVNAISNLLTAFIKLPQPTKQAIVVMGVVTAGFMAAAVAAGTLGIVLFGLEQAAASSTVAMLTMQRGILPLTGFFGTALEAFAAGNPTNALKLLNAQVVGLGFSLLTFLVSPLGLTIAGFTALYLIMEQLTPGFSVMGAVLSNVSKSLGYLQGFVKGFVTELLLIFKPVSDRIYQSFQGIFDVPLQFVRASLKQMAEAYNQSFADGEAMGRAIARALVNPFQAASQTVSSAWVKAKEIIVQQWNQLVAIASRIRDMIVGFLNHGAADATYFAWVRSVRGIIEQWSELVANARQVRSRIADTYEELSRTADTFLTDPVARTQMTVEAWKDVRTAIGDAIVYTRQFSKELIANLDFAGLLAFTLASLPLSLVKMINLNQANDILAGMFKGLPTVIAGILPVAAAAAIGSGFVQKMEAAIATSFEGTLQFIQKSARYLLGASGEQMAKDFNESVKNAVGRFNEGMEVISGLIQSITEPLFSLTGVQDRLVGAIAGGLLGALRSPIAGLQGLLTGLTLGFSDLVPAIFLKNALTGLIALKDSGAQLLAIFRAVGKIIVGTLKLLHALGSLLVNAILIPLKVVIALVKPFARQLDVFALLERPLSAIVGQIQALIRLVPGLSQLLSQIRLVAITAYNIVRTVVVVTFNYLAEVYQSLVTIFAQSRLLESLSTVGRSILAVFGAFPLAFGKAASAIVQFFAAFQRVRAVTPLDLILSPFTEEAARTLRAKLKDLTKPLKEGMTTLREGSPVVLKFLDKVKLLLPAQLQLVGALGLALGAVYVGLKTISRETLRAVPGIGEILALTRDAALYLTEQVLPGAISILLQFFGVLGYVAVKLAGLFVAIANALSGVYNLAHGLYSGIGLIVHTMAQGRDVFNDIMQSIREGANIDAPQWAIETLKILGRFHDVLRPIAQLLDTIGGLIGGIGGTLVKVGAAIAILTFGLRLLKTRNPIRAFMDTLLLIPKAISAAFRAVTLAKAAATKEGRNSLEYEIAKQSLKLSLRLVPKYDVEFQKGQLERRKQVLAFQEQIDNQSRRYLRQQGARGEVTRKSVIGERKVYSDQQLAAGRKAVMSDEERLRAAAFKSGVADFRKLAEINMSQQLRVLADRNQADEYINQGTINSQRLDAFINEANIVIQRANPVTVEQAGGTTTSGQVLNVQRPVQREMSPMVASVAEAAKAGNLGLLKQIVAQDAQVLFSVYAGKMKELAEMAMHLQVPLAKINKYVEEGDDEALIHHIIQHQHQMAQAITEYEQMQAQMGQAGQQMVQTMAEVSQKQINQQRQNSNAFLDAINEVAGVREIKSKFKQFIERIFPKPAEGGRPSDAVLAARRTEMYKLAGEASNPKVAATQLKMIQEFQKLSEEQRANSRKFSNMTILRYIADALGRVPNQDDINSIKSMQNAIANLPKGQVSRSVAKLSTIQSGGIDAVMAQSGFIPPGSGVEGAMNKADYNRLKTALEEGLLEDIAPEQLYKLSRGLKVSPAQLLNPLDKVPFAQQRQAIPLRQQFLDERLAEKGVENLEQLFNQVNSTLRSDAKLNPSRLKAQLELFSKGQTYRMPVMFLQAVAEALSATGKKAKDAVIELETEIAAQTLLAKAARENATVFGRAKQAFAAISPRRLAGVDDISYRFSRGQALKRVRKEIAIEQAAQQLKERQAAIGLKTQLGRRGLNLGNLQERLEATTEEFDQVLKHLYTGQVDSIRETQRIAIRKALAVEDATLKELHTLLPTQDEINQQRIDAIRTRFRALVTPLTNYIQQQYAVLKQRVTADDVPPAVKRLVELPEQIADGLSKRFEQLNKTREKVQIARRYSLPQLIQTQGYDTLDQLIKDLERAKVSRAEIEKFLSGPAPGQRLSQMVGQNAAKRIANAIGIGSDGKAFAEFDKEFTPRVVDSLPVYLGKQMAGVVRDRIVEAMQKLGELTVRAGRFGLRSAMAIVGPSINRFLAVQGRELAFSVSDIVNELRASFPSSRFLASTERLIRNVGLAVGGTLDQQAEAALALRQQMFGGVIALKERVAVGLTALVAVFQTTLDTVIAQIKSIRPAEIGQQLASAFSRAVGATQTFFKALLDPFTERSRQRRALMQQLMLNRDQQRAARENLRLQQTRIKAQLDEIEQAVKANRFDFAHLKGQSDVLAELEQRRRALLQEKELLKSQQQSIIQEIRGLGQPLLMELSDKIQMAFAAQFARLGEGLATVFEKLSGGFSKIAQGITVRRPRYTMLERSLRVRDPETGEPIPGERRAGMRRVIPLSERTLAGLETFAKQTAEKISVFFNNSAQRTRDAWARAVGIITGRSWADLIAKAVRTGIRIVGSLNHGAADRTSDAWERAETSITHNMDEIAQHSQIVGQEISGNLERAAHNPLLAFGKLFGALAAIGGIGAGLSSLGQYFAESNPALAETLGKLSEITFAIDGVVGAVGAIGQFGGGLLDFFTDENLTGFLGQVRGQITTMGQSIYDTLAPKLKPVLTKVQDMAIAMLDQVSAATTPIIEEMGKALVKNFSLLKSKLAGFAIDIGFTPDVIGNKFSDLKQKLGVITNGILETQVKPLAEGFAEAFSKSKAKLAGYAVDLAFIPNVVKNSFVSAFVSASTVVGTAVAPIAASMGAIATTVVTAMGTATAAVFAFIGPWLAVIGTVLAPIMPIILGVLAVTTLLGLVWKTNFLGMAKVVEPFFKFGRDLLKIAAAIIYLVTPIFLLKTVFRFLWLMLKVVGDQINQFFHHAKTGSAVAGAAAKKMNPLIAFFSGLFGAIAKAWRSVMYFTDAILGVGAAGDDVDVILLNLAHRVVFGIEGLFSSLPGAALAGLTQLGKAVFRWMTTIVAPNLIQGLLYGLLGLANAFKTFIFEWLPFAGHQFELLGPIIGNAFTKAKNFVQPLTDGISHFATQFLYLVGIVSGSPLFGALIGSGSDFLKTITGIGTYLKDQLVSLIETVVQQLSVLANTLSAPFQAASDAIDNILTKGQELVSKLDIGKFLGDAASGINGIFNRKSSPSPARSLPGQVMVASADQSAAQQVMPSQTISQRWTQTGEHVEGVIASITDTSQTAGQELLGNLAEASPGPTFMIRQRWGETADYVADRLSMMRQASGKTFGNMTLFNRQQIASDIDYLKQRTQQLGSDIVQSALTFDMEGLKASLQSYREDFKAVASNIIGQFKSMGMAAIAFGITSILSVAPFALVIGALILGAIALATNFLGIRTILGGVFKIVIGIGDLAITTILGVLRVIKGVLQILGGIPAALTGDFDQIKAGVLTVFNAIKDMAKGLVRALGRIFGGGLQIIEGIFEGLAQAVGENAFGRMLTSVKEFVTKAREWVEGLAKTLSDAVMGPTRAWGGFFSKVNRGAAQTEAVATGGTAEKVGIRQRFGGIFGRKPKSPAEQVAVPPVEAVAATAASPVATPPVVPPVTPSAVREMAMDFDAVDAEFAALAAKQRQAVTSPRSGLNGLIDGLSETEAGLVSLQEKNNQALNATTQGLSSLGIALNNFAPQLAGPLFVVTDLIDAFMGVKQAASAIKAAITGQAAATTAANTGVAASNTFLGISFTGVATAASTAWAAITGPLLPVIAVIAAVIAVVGLLALAIKKNFLGIGDAVAPVFNAIKSFFTTIIDIGRQFYSQLAAGFMEIVQGFRDSIGAAIGSIWDAIKGLAAVFFDAFKPLAEMFGGGGGGGWLSNAIKATVTVILGPMKILMAILGFVIRLVGKIIAIAISALKPIMMVVSIPFRIAIAAFQGLFNIFRGLFSAIGNLFGTIFSAVGQLWSAFVDVGRAIAEAFSPLLAIFGGGGGGGGLLTGAIKFVVGVLLTPIRIVIGALTLILNIVSFIIKAVAAVLAPAIRLLAIPFKLIGAVVQGIFNVISGIGSMIVGIFTTLWNIIPPPIKWLIELIGKGIGFVGNLLFGGGSSKPQSANASVDVQQFATGGWVEGSGGGRIPAYVHADEFVVNSRAAQQNASFLEAINSGMSAESALKLIPSIPTPIVMPPMLTPGSTAAASSDSIEGRPIHFHLSINEVNIGADVKGKEATEEFVASLEPAIKQKLREWLREEVEMSRAGG